MLLSTEVLKRIRNSLETWPEDNLVAAIADHEFEVMVEDGLLLERAIQAFDRRIAELCLLSHESLSDHVLQLVQQNGIYDGNGYWIDKKGFHVVCL